MATLISTADGNLTTAATWALVSTAGLLDSEGGNTALTTGNLDSSTFVLEANQIDGFAVKLASRATGSPANTITFILRNSTTGTNIWSVTLNVSDLDPCSTTAYPTGREGGWYFINPGATHTPNGTDSYVIRMTMSATSTAVSLWTNGTANNWSRIIRRTTTGAPAAGDNMHIVAEWTAAATKTNRSITMNQTVATDYGAATTGTAGQQAPAFSVNKGGTLVWGTTASTNYLLRISGWINVYSGGTWNQGTTGTPIPRTSTAQLELDSAADGDFGFQCLNGSTVNIQGLSRTSGKNVVWTVLNADAAAAATALTVLDDTGWLNGDVIGIALTTKTTSQTESATLNADATSTGLSLSAGLSNAHSGTAAQSLVAEVILLTRNVRIKGTNSSFGYRFLVGLTPTADIDWCEFQYLSQTDAITLPNSFAGTLTISYCAIRDNRGNGIHTSGSFLTGAVFTFEHSVQYGTVGNFEAILVSSAASSGGAVKFDDLVLMKGTGQFAFSFNDTGVAFWTIGAIRIAGCTSGGFNWISGMDWNGATIGPFVVHGTTTAGAFELGGNTQNVVIAGLKTWRNSSVGCTFSGTKTNVEVTSALGFGNTTANFSLQGSLLVNVVFHNLQSYGDTSFAVTNGIDLFSAGAGVFADIRVEKGDFGTAAGVWTTHTNDVNIAAALRTVRLVFNNTLMASTNKIVGLTGASINKKSYVLLQRFQRTATNHQAQSGLGNLTYETTTVDVSPSLKMTPLSATLKLRSNLSIPGFGFLVPVSNGAASTISMKVRKDGTYNGNAPRLVLLQNSALGQDSDSVLATLSVGANTWETLSGAAPAATDDGVWEVIVDCDGTAGNVFVDTGAAS